MWQGFEVVPDALTPEEVARFRPFFHEASKNTEIIKGVSETAPIYPYVPEHLELIRRGAEILKNVGLNDPRFVGGAVIPKRIDEGRRWNHVDWWAWSYPETRWETPAQAGVIFYLDKADEAAGALIVTPWSHKQWRPGHLRTLDTKDVRPDERVLEVEAGDAIILDSRTMHAVTGPNTSGKERIAVTMWYQPDWEHLSADVKKTTMQGIPPSFADTLKELCPTHDGSGFPMPHYKVPDFPPNYDDLNKARYGEINKVPTLVSDALLLGEALQEIDKGREFTSGDNCYSWYYAIGKLRAPERILEMGVRYGYSAVAMCKGAVFAGAGARPYWMGIDCEADHPGSNAVAVNNLQSIAVNAHIYQEDTKSVREGFDIFPPTEHEKCDVVHVDGDHSEEGLRAELAIAEKVIARAGWIVVDDVGYEPIRSITIAWAEEHGYSCLLIDSFNGLAILSKPA